MQRNQGTYRIAFSVLWLGLVTSAFFSLHLRADEPDSVFSKPPEDFKKLRPKPHLPPVPPQKPLPVVEPLPVLEEVEGNASVRAIGKSGSARNVTQNGPIEFGETIQVGSDSAARVVYPDGSQILMTGNSQVGIVHATPADTGVEGAQPPMASIESGEVRLLIEGDGKAASSGKFRFLVHAHGVVMGVRGTDFVVKSDGDHASVHTFTGLVEVASDFGALHNRAGTQVGSGQHGEALKGSKLIAVKPFAVDNYLKEFHQRHPTLEPMWNRAVLDAKSGRLKNRKYSTAVPHVAPLQGMRAKSRVEEAPKQSVGPVSEVSSKKKNEKRKKHRRK